MKTTQRITLLLILISTSWLQAQQAVYTLHGSVWDSLTQHVLEGAAVQVMGEENIGSVTDESGRFTLSLTEGTYTLEVRYLGYRPKQLLTHIPGADSIHVNLAPSGISLGEVEIVSTGYQELPRERATGSFAILDEKLIQRRVSTHLTDRLEDVVPGLILNRSGPSNDPISIRGRSTLYANARPLIVVDGFPYEGDLASINPNDVENITVLRDAAAASIWGARAGNGVIVITTKQGTYDEPLKVSFNSNVTVGEKPDLFYTPRMTTAEYIDNERRLFDDGNYEGTEHSTRHTPLTPVVESFIAHRDGLISGDELENRLENWKGLDVRSDFEKYLYRSSLNQQYSLSMRGGGMQHRYAVSIGYDHNLQTLIGNTDHRWTLRWDHQWRGMNDRLTLSLNSYFSSAQTRITNGGAGDVTFYLNEGAYPYAQLVGEDGAAFPLIRDYRRSFVLEAENAGLLNWEYYPLEEIGRTQDMRRHPDFRINPTLKFEFLPGLSATLAYRYWQSENRDEQYYAPESYYARDLINRYTQVDDEEFLSFPVPRGGILDQGVDRAWSHTIRGQIRYHTPKSNGVHNLTTIGGYEIRDLRMENRSNRFYGYNPERATSQLVDYVNRYEYYYSPGSRSTIPANEFHNLLTDRFISYYGNASYFYKGRYGMTVSARKDLSNLFGVEANQRGVPLWSAGLSWNVSDESFFRWSFLPYLKLRATYGYNGNIDKKLTAQTTARFASGLSVSANPVLPYASIENPPNPELRWERIQNLNFGADFTTKGNRLQGSIEYYLKNGLDLIGDRDMAPSNGVTSFRGNYAHTRGKGLDIKLTSLNTNGNLNWKTVAFLSWNQTKVSQYLLEAPATSYVSNSSIQVVPLEGRPLLSLYSYSWAGLDPQTGDPRGYSDGEVSTDYNGIVNGTPVDQLVFHGTVRPTVFGALRNELSWEGWTLSLNISYRLGYYYRRRSIIYRNVLDGGMVHGDYSERWQQPGDEAFTHVPSRPERYDSNRDRLYQFSEVLVEKGDHIRWQDVRLSYALDRRKMPGLPVSHAEFYCYVNNIGILWKASDDPLDPDFRSAKPRRSVAVGVRVEF